MPGLEIIYNKTLKMYDLSVNCNIGRNRRFTTRKQKYQLKNASKLFDTAFAWSALTQIQKDLWYTAGDVSGINGYALFCQDKVYRLMNEIGGNATPSIYHQYKIGHVMIEAPANSCTVEENHITPFVNLTTVKISYKTDLIASGGIGSAKLIFRGLRFIGGQNIEDDDEIVMALSEGWKNGDVTVPEREGTLISWKILLEVENAIGDVWFDNLFVEYSATIQNRDPLCEEFPTYWIKKDVEEGVTLESIYCPDVINI